MGPVTAFLVGLAVAVVAYGLVRLSDTYRRMREHRQIAAEDWASRERYNQTQDWTK